MSVTYSNLAHQAQQYQDQQIQTASSEQLLLMLYDGVIRFLMIAKNSLQSGDVTKAHKYLIKAQHIITEFMSTLDLEIGGDVAKRLYALYEYYYFQLVQANLQKNVKIIDEVLWHMRLLRQTWDEAIKIAAREQRQDAQTSTPGSDSEDETLDFPEAMGESLSLISRRAVTA